MKNTIIAFVLMAFHSTAVMSEDIIPEIIIDENMLSNPLTELSLTNGPDWYSIRDLRLGQSSNFIKNKFPEKSKHVNMSGYTALIWISKKKDNNFAIGFSAFDDNGKVGLGPVSMILLEQTLGPLDLNKQKTLKINYLQSMARLIKQVRQVNRFDILGKHKQRK